jgi:orotate phosphoribosyltransferase
VSVLKADLIALIRAKGLDYREEPLRLSSGAMSHHFIDGKRAVAAGPDLRLACNAILATTVEHDVDFDVVAGLTMGADSFAHGIALLADKDWSIVRKAPKEHGTRRRIEGALLGPGRRVLLVDDVITMGDSILDALHAITDTGAEVVGALSLVDRGEHARPKFAAINVPYFPLATYADLGIPPVELTPSDEPTASVA